MHRGRQTRRLPRHHPGRHDQVQAQLHLRGRQAVGADGPGRRGRVQALHRGHARRQAVRGGNRGEAHRVPPRGRRPLAPFAPFRRPLRPFRRPFRPFRRRLRARRVGRHRRDGHREGRMERGAPTPDVETIVDRSGDAEFSAWYDEAPDAGHVASHVTHDAYAVARVPSGVFPSVPGLFGADGFLEYGGFRDNSSCGVVEHVVVLGGGGRNESNPAAGHGTDGYDMPALGFFGCGFATKVEHVEVAHSAGHGLYLGGGMVSPRRVAAWDNAGAGVKTTAGYRGVLDELFVHVPRGSNATGIRAEGFWAHGGGTADESVYRTHPMIFHATVVAEPNPPPPPMNESAASAACQRPSWVGSDGYGALDGTDRDEIYGTGSDNCQREYFPLPSGCEIAQDSDETLEVIRNHPWGTHAMNTQTAIYSTSSYPESIWQRSPLVRVGAGGENEYKPFSCSFRILIICCPEPPPPPPPAPLPALVQIARGSGATVGNSIIAPSTEGASRSPWTTAAPNSEWAISATSTPRRLRRRATTPSPSTIASPSRAWATIPRRKTPTTGITTGRGRGAWWTRRRCPSTSARGARMRPCGASTGTRRSLGAAPSPWTRGTRLRIASTPAPPPRWWRRRSWIPSRRASSTAWRLDATRARRGCWTRSFTGPTPS